ncbi:hypothetical protein Tco_0886889 [Tanacetum coccineum]
MDPAESTALCVAGNGFTTTRTKFVSSSSYDLILYIGSVTDMTPGVSEVVVLAAVVKVVDEEKERYRWFGLYSEMLPASNQHPMPVH